MSSDSFSAEPEMEPWFRVAHRLHPYLPEGFPPPALVERNPLDFRHTDTDGWTGYWPAEDHAQPPQADWTKAHEVLVLWAYQQKWGRSLEKDESYQISWPPEGHLTTEGHVGREEVCTHHGRPLCDECEEVTEVTEHITPAEWTWAVTVEKCRFAGGEWARDPVGDFPFMTTLMDPRDVDYSP